MKKSPSGAPQRRSSMKVASLILAASVAVQGLPSVTDYTAATAAAAEVPTAAAWNNIVEADNFKFPGSDLQSKSDLDNSPSSIWGALQFADRATMESDDIWSAWRDTNLPEGTPVYMRYKMPNGQMSRIHKAVTHSVNLRGSEALVYSFRFMDGQPNLTANDYKDGSADLQLMIGENNIGFNPQVRENYAAVRLAPGGNYYGGNIADSREINWFLSRGPENQRTWGETSIKVYQTSPAATTLRNRISEPTDSVQRTYSGRVWIDTMNATKDQNYWGGYSDTADNGVVFDVGSDEVAAGYTVYQAVPNAEAYAALNEIRRVTNTGVDFRRSNTNILLRQKQMSDYVRNHPENFKVYTATTDSLGNYTLKTSFEESKYADYIYMWVEGDGGIKTNLSAWTTPEFRNPIGEDDFAYPDAHGWTPSTQYTGFKNGHVPYQQHLGDNPKTPKSDVSGNWENVNFALAQTPGGGSHTVTPIDPPKNNTPGGIPGLSSDGGSSKDGLGGSSSNGGDSNGSSDGNCAASAAGFIAPLMMLIPLALLSQIQLPGLERIQAQLSESISRANTDLQRSLGIFDENTASEVKRIFGGGIPIREILSGLLVLAAAGLSIAVADQVAKSCLDDYDGMSSTLDKDGSGKKN